MKKKENLKLIGIILGVLLLVGLAIFIAFKLVNKKEDQKTPKKEEDNLTYKVNEDCLKYLDTLEEITYDNLLESDYKDTLIEYNTIYEQCEDENCFKPIENDYLVCLSAIKYNDEDLQASLDNNTLSITKLENKLKEEQLEKVIIKNKVGEDKEPPVLELQEVTITKGEKYDVNTFVKSCTDNSNKECLLSFSDEKMSSYSAVKTYDIEIKAEDESGNITTAKTKLTIKEKTSKNDTSNSKDTTPSNNQTTNNNQMSNNQNNNNQTNDNQNSNPETTTPSKTITCEEKLSTGWTPYFLPNFIEYQDEDVIIDTKYVYGVKVETVAHRTYAVFSDAGKCLYKEYKSEKYDRSGYHATTAELQAEATTVLNSNESNILKGIEILNGYRSEVGKPPLTYNRTLALAATIRAIEMYWSGKFDHTRPDGSRVYSIYSEMGLSSYAQGENIAAGYNTIESAMEGWKNSTGHYNNMINDNFNEVGIGYYKSYYSTLFM